MKRFFSLITTLMLLIGIVVDTQAADREHTLKIYNWADYIDMDNVLNKFPEWYKEQTGEEVEVLYQTFDINESMLTEIEVAQEDYDVICPSEYIIERMLRQGLLQKINKDFGNTPNYTDSVSQFAIDKFQEMAPDNNTCVADYTVGYMWGTTGILYNTAYVKEEDIRSLGGLLDPKFSGKIFMKDAYRDVYSVVVLYVYRDEIARGEVTRDDLVANVTKERIERVEEYLNELKHNVAGWEVDFGKEQMTKGKVWMNLSWSGDAQWAIDEAPEGVELKYLVPEEGSNIWFDGWCIPKYAKNTKAASYFINYMCMPENAILNMEEIGYVSVVSSPRILEWANDAETYPTPSDLSYFFGPDADSVHVNNIFYPDKSVIDRCALMHDCGDKTEDLINMWSRIKGDNLSTGMVVFVCIILSLIVVVFILQVINRRRQRKLQQKKRKHKKNN
jgi:spermidine/putrescine transport system substrate-binding protein